MLECHLSTRDSELFSCLELYVGDGQVVCQAVVDLARKAIALLGNSCAAHLLVQRLQLVVGDAQLIVKRLHTLAGPLLADDGQT